MGDGTKIWHFVHIRKGAKLGAGCNIGKGVYIDSGVNIGDNVKVQNFVSLYTGLKVEEDVFIGPSATFTNDLYPRAHIWNEERIAKTLVKKGASIGANVTVVAGITIGEYAMIGAGSVVTKDVHPHTIVYGNPARVGGYVCRCGQKLEKIAEEKDESTVHACRCGKKAEIKKVGL